MPVLHDHQAMSDPVAKSLHQRLLHSVPDRDCSGLHWHFAFPADVHGDKNPLGEPDPNPSLFASTAALHGFSASDATSDVICSFAAMEERNGFDHWKSLTRHVSQCRLSGAPPSTLLFDAPLSSVTGVCLI